MRAVVVTLHPWSLVVFHVSWGHRGFQILVSLQLKGLVVPLLPRYIPFPPSLTPHHGLQEHGFQAQGEDGAGFLPSTRSLVAGAHLKLFSVGNFYLVCRWGRGWGWYGGSSLCFWILCLWNKHCSWSWKCSASWNPKNIFSYCYQLRKFAVNPTSPYWCSNLCNKPSFLCPFWQ